VPATTPPPPGYVIHAEIQLEVPVEHGLLIENLLDLAHAPFTHQATFAKGWPVPDVVKFHAQRMLSGQWDPYPIEMAFQPPCMVRGHSAARCMASSLRLCMSLYILPCVMQGSAGCCDCCDC
jgi:chlorophyllide a oxygenase